MDSPKKSMLVFSAHAADFVWRAGGAIALYAQRGYRVRILCLSLGERGESQGLWKKPGMTMDVVKAERKMESSRAAGILGAEVHFFDAGDYPLRGTDELLHGMVQEFRNLQPEIILTHSVEDPYNTDHVEAHKLSIQSRILSQAMGYPAEGKALGAPPVFMFEPHQPEQCNFKPQLLLDITSVHEVKNRAMESMIAQEHLWTYYTDLAKRRGVQAVRNSERREIKFAEAYQRFYPQVTNELS